jgi:hypothetical protein
VYAPGDVIKISFTGAPGNNGQDWIGIYPYGTQPKPGSFAWQFIDGTHTAGASPAMGTININAASIGSSGTWPFPVGQYIAYYLLNNGYTAAASIDFTVQ